MLLVLFFFFNTDLEVGKKIAAERKYVRPYSVGRRQTPVACWNKWYEDVMSWQLWRDTTLFSLTKWQEGITELESGNPIPLSAYLEEGCWDWVQTDGVRNDETQELTGFLVIVHSGTNCHKYRLWTRSTCKRRTLTDMARVTTYKQKIFRQV